MKVVMFKRTIHSLTNVVNLKMLNTLVGKKVRIDFNIKDTYKLIAVSAMFI